MAHTLNIWSDELGKYVRIPLFKGEKGDKGDLPVKGIDYFTEEDKQQLINEMSEKFCIVDINEVVNNFQTFLHDYNGTSKNDSGEGEDI